MYNAKILSAAAVLAAGVFASTGAHAGMVTDAHGNVGYDNAAECDAAVQNGNAKFYQSFTTKPALRRAGETQVKVTRLADLGGNYRLGACDAGAAHQFGRDGVSKALQGKYVPYSPNMAVNVYANATGQPVRVSMKQCDNNFSGPIPRPVAIPQPVATSPVVIVPPAPVIAPVVAKTLSPYVFGTVGALRDKVGGALLHDRDTEVAGQLGAGLQFNKLVGAELFYQYAKRHDFTDGLAAADVRNKTFGGRVTLGGLVADKTRLFAKLGAASVKHTSTGYSDRKTRLTAGAGLAYSLTNNLALRADYDHYFKRGANWKAADYLGLGLQYNF
ncbi:hypothetical protein DTO96_100712 [Ephemeroptericola cinctiostellae]|uniref:Outer membrane protein beta-barrel domain-containing protein n=1 Tax=Ephemeroptericola cinctiostellae TaxID=2268024 RepID=A0A345D9F7_9BURK|nr:outer membrane beta-barrel protein [Ephemeroptericola cinctiostellae]AXF84995.1 hypothetical protein DTO96_100712 [Ephemeroptericola cinctiostellae]